MKKKVKKTNKASSVTISQKSTFNYLFLPILAFIFIVTTIIKMNLIPFEESIYNLTGEMYYFDFWTRSKFYVLLVFSVIMIAFAAFSHKSFFSKKSKAITVYIILASVLVLFAFLSACFSDYKAVSFGGLNHHSQGFFSLLCYIIIFVYALFSYRDKKDIKNLLIVIAIITVFNLIVGYFQYTGKSILDNNLIRSLVVGEYGNYLDISISSESNFVGTFMNSNYVGSFAALFFPVFTFAIFAAKDIKLKIAAGIANILLLIFLIGSGSRAGLLGIALLSVIAVIAFICFFFSKKKTAIIFLAAIVTAGCSAFLLPDSIKTHADSIVSDAKALFTPSDVDYMDSVPVKNIINSDGKITYITENHSITISYDGSEFVFTDENNNIIPFVVRENYRYLYDEYNGCGLYTGKLSEKSEWDDGAIVFMRGFYTTARINPDNTMHLTNITGAKDIELEFPETIGFKGKERLGSGRGFIWSRTFPLLKKTILIGSGPDTFGFVFPSNDLTGMYYVFGAKPMAVSKPHNLFMQFWVEYGGIAFIAFMCIVVAYIVDSTRLYFFKKEYTPDMLLGVSFCLGIIGFLTTGIFNDFMITTAPLFWIILGLGAAINFSNSNAKAK